MGAVTLGRGDSSSNWGLTALAMMLGGAWVGEMVVNRLDHIPNPLGSALLAILARREGLAVLGAGVPEERLDSFLGRG